VYIDFFKAFDKMHHLTLLRKLYQHGIRGVPYDWFLLYLSNRKHIVHISRAVNERSMGFNFSVADTTRAGFELTTPSARGDRSNR